MRRMMVLCVVVALAAPAIAQEAVQTMTYGEFAALVVETVTTDESKTVEAQEALNILKGYGFLPLEWLAEGVLTQGGLAAVMAPTPVTYSATVAEAPVPAADVRTLVEQNKAALVGYFSDLEEEQCTHGEFAVLLVRTITPPQDALPDALTALDLLKRAGLIPLGWLPPEILTHGELADVLARLGVIYEVVDPNEPVSLPYVIAFLRRELSMVKDYWAKRTGHGFSTNHVLDLGVDRAVSPSAFYYRAHVHINP